VSPRKDAGARSAAAREAQPGTAQLTRHGATCAAELCGHLVSCIWRCRPRLQKPAGCGVFSVRNPGASPFTRRSDQAASQSGLVPRKQTHRASDRAVNRGWRALWLPHRMTQRWLGTLLRVPRHVADVTSRELQLHAAEGSCLSRSSGAWKRPRQPWRQREAPRGSRRRAQRWTWLSRCCAKRTRRASACAPADEPAPHPADKLQLQQQEGRPPLHPSATSSAASLAPAAAPAWSRACSVAGFVQLIAIGGGAKGAPSPFSLAADAKRKAEREQDLIEMGIRLLQKLVPVKTEEVPMVLRSFFAFFFVRTPPHSLLLCLRTCPCPSLVWVSSATDPPKHPPDSQKVTPTQALNGVPDCRALLLSLSQAQRSSEKKKLFICPLHFPLPFEPFALPARRLGCVQLLAAYFLCQPLRDEAAMSLGTGSLPGLFTASLAATLGAAPLSSLAARARTPPRGRRCCCCTAFLRLPAALPRALTSWCRGPRATRYLLPAALLTGFLFFTFGNLLISEFTYKSIFNAVCFKQLIVSGLVGLVRLLLLLLYRFFSVCLLLFLVLYSPRCRAPPSRYLSHSSSFTFFSYSEIS